MRLAFWLLAVALLSGLALSNLPAADPKTGATDVSWKKTTLDGFARPTKVETGHGTTTVSVADTEYAACACVPLIVRAPGLVKAGTVITQMVQNIDIAPSLLDAVGVKSPADAPPGPGRKRSPRPPIQPAPPAQESQSWR